MKRLLDLFCGAGGASMGYHRAGFEVVGVDIEPQPNYPFEFIQADALSFVADLGFGPQPTGFDAIHASPPCQHSTAYKRRPNHVAPCVNLIGPTRGWLSASGLPYVIENVPGARSFLREPVTLCGSSFGLDVRRHRLFESNMPLVVPPCDHSWQTPRFPPATNRTNLRSTVEVGVWRIPLAVQRAAMGIDWMELDELSEAIPPAYTEWIGRQLMASTTGALRCPDDGACHHECAGTDCFRVRYCGPLSGVFPGDEWPTGLVETVVPGPEIGHL